MSFLQRLLLTTAGALAGLNVLMIGLRASGPFDWFVAAFLIVLPAGLLLAGLVRSRHKIRWLAGALFFGLAFRAFLGVAIASQLNLENATLHRSDGPSHSLSGLHLRAGTWEGEEDFLVCSGPLTRVRYRLTLLPDGTGRMTQTYSSSRLGDRWIQRLFPTECDAFYGCASPTRSLVEGLWESVRYALPVDWSDATSRSHPVRLRGSRYLIHEREREPELADGPWHYDAWALSFNGDDLRYAEVWPDRDGTLTVEWGRPWKLSLFDL